jgi:hypothetical protein
MGCYTVTALHPHSNKREGEGMEELLKRKLLEGTLAQEEWDALAVADRERLMAEALRAAVTETVAAEKASGSNGRLPAGAMFSDWEKPPEGAEVMLPAGYAVTAEGVWRAVVMEDAGNLKAHVKRLTPTPIFVAARDAGSGRVRVMVWRGSWHGEWVAASRLTANKLADWFVFPARGVKVREVIEYMQACVLSAPYVVAQDEIAVAAIEILHELFPARAAGVEFPALRAFPEIRGKCEDLGVDPMKVRDWWLRMGLILEGASRVGRYGREGKPTRLIAFTAKVREFLAETLTFARTA